MAFNVGPIEHLHHVRLHPGPGPRSPVAAGETADEVARKMFDRGGFTCFARLPQEIQNMIWKATFEPRTFRAWGYNLHKQREKAPFWCLEIEAKPSRAYHIPAFRVCRRSRDLALAAYGSPCNDSSAPPQPDLDNPVPFHPDLDTLEVLGCYLDNYRKMVEFGPLVSRDASEQDGVEYVSLIHRNTRIERGGSWAERVHQSQDEESDRDPPRHWVCTYRQFKRAKNVVLCHDARSERTLHIIATWGRAMLPNVETLTVRSYIGESLEPAEEKQQRVWLSRAIKPFMDGIARGTVWPRMRTVDFTRQHAPKRDPEGLAEPIFFH
ncbi:hypothetical protein IMZ48_27050 [Candidatus Bathyarchaeota archaeon]|nr:hypothetical protein [Candidatus Bathyarchaeota archaeon]